MSIADEGRAIIKARANSRKRMHKPLAGHALEERNRFGKDIGGYLEYRDKQRLKAHAQALKDHPERFDANGRPKPEWAPPPRPADPERFRLRIRPDKPGDPKPRFRTVPAPGKKQLSDLTGAIRRGTPPKPQPIRRVPQPITKGPIQRLPQNSTAKQNAVKKLLNNQR